MKRTANIKRKTSETEIYLDFNLDGSGVCEIDTPVPFFNHVLSSFTRHGKFDLKIKATGDIEVDTHHLIEDIGICLGRAVNKCLENKAGIERFGFAIIPMDDALIILSIDIGGRSYLRYSVDILNENIGNMQTILIEDFFRAFTENANVNLHITKNAGLNSHHIIEGIFKSFGFALMKASRLSGSDIIPSTKGTI
mgnify:CR=1 FL=1